MAIEEGECWSFSIPDVHAAPGERSSMQKSTRFIQMFSPQASQSTMRQVVSLLGSHLPQLTVGEAHHVATNVMDVIVHAVAARASAALSATTALCTEQGLENRRDLWWMQAKEREERLEEELASAWKEMEEKEQKWGMMKHRLTAELEVITAVVHQDDRCDRTDAVFDKQRRAETPERTTALPDSGGRGSGKGAERRRPLCIINDNQVEEASSNDASMPPLQVGGGGGKKMKSKGGDHGVCTRVMRFKQKYMKRMWGENIPLHFQQSVFVTDVPRGGEERLGCSVVQCRSKQQDRLSAATTRNDTRFLRSLLQRRGVKGGMGMCSMVVKLHAFAWEGKDMLSRAEESSATRECKSCCESPQGAAPFHLESKEAGLRESRAWRVNFGGSEALYGYVDSQGNCPRVLLPTGPGGHNAKPMLGQKMLRFLKRWHSNTVLPVVALGFRRITLLLRCYQTWRLWAGVCHSLERLGGYRFQNAEYRGPDEGSCVVVKYYDFVIPSVLYRQRLLVRGWTDMLDTVLKLITIASDTSNRLSAHDRLLIENAAVTCKCRWISTVQRHLLGWRSVASGQDAIRLEKARSRLEWHQGQLRKGIICAWHGYAMRVKTARSRREWRQGQISKETIDAWHEWIQRLLRIKMVVKEVLSRLGWHLGQLSRVILHTWREWTKRLRVIGVWIVDRHHASVKRYKATVFGTMLHLLAIRRGSSLLSTPFRRVVLVNSCLAWQRRTAILLNARDFFKSLRSCSMRRLVCGWAAYASSSDVHLKREHRIIAKSLSSRLLLRRFKLLVGKWRLFSAMSAYMRHLLLVGKMRTWLDYAQERVLQRTHLRRIFETRVRSQVVHKWHMIAGYLAQHRAWKVLVSDMYNAGRLRAFQEACLRHQSCLKAKLQSRSDAESLAFRNFCKHYIAVAISSWRSLAVKARNVHHIQSVVTVRLKRHQFILLLCHALNKKDTIQRVHYMRGKAAANLQKQSLIILARFVCSNYLATQCEAHLIARVLGQWQLHTASMLQLRRDRADLCFSLANTSAEYRRFTQARCARAWHLVFRIRKGLDSLHAEVVERDAFRLKAGVLQALIHQYVVSAATRRFAMLRVAAESKRFRQLIAEVVLVWRKFTAKRTAEASLYARRKDACMHDLLQTFAKWKWANLHGVFVILSRSLEAWKCCVMNSPQFLSAAQSDAPASANSAAQRFNDPGKGKVGMTFGWTRFI